MRYLSKILTDEVKLSVENEDDMALDSIDHHIIESSNHSLFVMISPRDPNAINSTGN